MKYTHILDEFKYLALCIVSKLVPEAIILEKDIVSLEHKQLRIMLFFDLLHSRSHALLIIHSNNYMKFTLLHNLQTSPLYLKGDSLNTAIPR